MGVDMLDKSNIALRDASPYNAAITREQFLFYEVRTTAKLKCEGLSDEEVVERIVQDKAITKASADYSSALHFVLPFVASD